MRLLLAALAVTCTASYSYADSQDIDRVTGVWQCVEVCQCPNPNPGKYACIKADPDKKSLKIWNECDNETTGSYDTATRTVTADSWHITGTVNADFSRLKWTTNQTVWNKAVSPDPTFCAQ
ncbi:MAG: hypothetical protein BGN87_18395 [Rhizobiales bacterium 65-79]|nr:hypothetical protein [Hyphomicrobiales bacterium]OJU03574.1 MAG: hypothetical protein BGN87_18395 [Rhizobiales bacterium 65-79]